MFRFIFLTLLSRVILSDVIENCYNPEYIKTPECKHLFKKGFFDLEKHVQVELGLNKKDHRGFRYITMPKLDTEVIKVVYPIIVKEALKRGIQIKHGSELLDVRGEEWKMVFCLDAPCTMTLAPKPSLPSDEVEEKVEEEKKEDKEEHILKN